MITATNVVNAHDVLMLIVSHIAKDAIKKIENYGLIQRNGIKMNMDKHVKADKYNNLLKENKELKKEKIRLLHQAHSYNYDKELIEYQYEEVLEELEETKKKLEETKKEHEIQMVNSEFAKEMVIFRYDMNLKELKKIKKELEENIVLPVEEYYDLVIGNTKLKKIRRELEEERKKHKEDKERSTGSSLIQCINCGKLVKTKSKIYINNLLSNYRCDECLGRTKDKEGE